MSVGRAKIGGRPSANQDDTERLQRALRVLRDERFGKNAVKLAKALGLSQSAVSQLLSGKTTPSLTTVRRIAVLSNLTVGQLLDGKEFEPFPGRALAVQVARDGGLPEEAIEAVLQEPAEEDAPALFWLKRIEMFAARPKVA